jgi:predicted nuclease of predicted toxin-antitoxin system
LRFVLDNDVDAGVQRVFRKAGHECWRGADGGHSETDDDELAVYANDRGAVLVTHDREFTERRKRNTIAQHVRLTCQQPDACDVVRTHMDELITVLQQHQEVVVEVSSEKVKFFHPQWL